MTVRDDAVQTPAPDQAGWTEACPGSALRVMRSPVGLMALALLLLITVAILTDEILRPGRFTIERVNIVSTLKQVDAPTIERTVWQKIKGNYFTIDLSDIESHLAQLPGVYRAAVRRVWPDALAVSITESDSIARWQSSSGMTLAKSEFVNLPPATRLSSQPLLSSDTADREKVIETCLELTRILGPLGLEPSAVSMGSAGGFRLEVSSKSGEIPGRFEIVAGRGDLLNKVSRFVAAFDLVLRDRLADIERVDLRYSSGFAVQWKGVTGSTIQLADSTAYGN